MQLFLMLQELLSKDLCFINRCTYLDYNFFLTIKKSKVKKEKLKTKGRKHNLFL